MSLWTTALFCILFTGVVYSTESDTLLQCDRSGDGKTVEECIHERYGLPLTTSRNDKIKEARKEKAKMMCCFGYYSFCVDVKSGFCKPQSEFDKTLKNFTGCVGKHCLQHHKDVDKSKCQTYTYPDCEDYSWTGGSSPSNPDPEKKDTPHPEEEQDKDTPAPLPTSSAKWISMNGWVLLSIVVSTLLFNFI